MVRATVAVKVDDSDGVRSLARWFRDEDEFRGRARVTEQPIGPAHMGGAVEALVVAATSGSVEAFVSALVGWFRHRRGPSAVSLKLSTDTGRELELTCGSQDDAQQLLDRVRVFFDDGA